MLLVIAAINPNLECDQTLLLMQWPLLLRRGPIDRQKSYENLF